jgi:hypothetical protein
MGSSRGIFRSILSGTCGAADGAGAPKGLLNTFLRQKNAEGGPGFVHRGLHHVVKKIPRTLRAAWLSTFPFIKDTRQSCAVYRNERWPRILISPWRIANEVNHGIVDRQQNNLVGFVESRPGEEYASHLFPSQTKKCLKLPIREEWAFNSRSQALPYYL